MTNIQLITIITFWIITLAIGFGVLAHKAGGQEVIMTASVRYNNCNIVHSYMPYPEISHIWQNEWGFNFMGTVGGSPFWALRSEDRLDFYLDEAHWWVTEEGVYYGECNM
jgi:hypothetical protein